MVVIKGKGGDSAAVSTTQQGISTLLLYFVFIFCSLACRQIALDLRQA